jgi:hypothetical protein
MKWLFWGFTLLFILALAVFASNMLDLFGQTPSALAGVYLLPFGLPWNLLGTELDDPFPLMFGLGGPLLNMAILWSLWRWSEKRKG